MTHSTATGRRAARTADGEGEAWWFYGDRAVLRSPAGVVPVIIEHHVGPGAAAPLHVHHDVDDSFYLLRGQLAMRCGEDTFAASAVRVQGGAGIVAQARPCTVELAADVGADQADRASLAGAGGGEPWRRNAPWPTCKP